MFRLFLLSTLQLARAGPIDRVLVDVDGQLVLASELSIEAELVALDPSPTPFWSHRSPQDRLVDAAVIRRVAVDVALYQPSKEAVQGRLEAVRSAFASRGAWARFLTDHGLDEERLKAVLRRRIQVELFLLRNVQVSPLQAAPWHAATAELIGRLRQGVRIRAVAPGEQLE